MNNIGIGRVLGLLPLQLCLVVPALAQSYPQGDAMRELYRLNGVGVVGREIAGEVLCEGDESGFRIPLRMAPEGPVVAELEQRRSQFGSCQVFLNQGEESERLWRGWDFPEISYESTALVYFEERNGYVRVLERTVPPGLWVRIADVPGEGLRSWPELFVESERLYLGYDGHELRSEPSEFSASIVQLRDREVHDTEVHQLIPTGAVSGDWGEFEVIEYDREFYILAQVGDANPTGNRWKGWLRLADEAGLPEFWFFTRD